MTNRALLSIFVVTIASMAFSGCAHQSKKEKAIAERASQEPAVSSPQEVADRAHEILGTAENLSDKQKEKLRELITRTASGSTALRGRMGQLKSLFFKELSSQDYRAENVRVIKRKISKLHKQQLDLMLDALAEAQLILGRNVSPDTSERVFRAMAGSDGRP